MDNIKKDVSLTDRLKAERAKCRIKAKDVGQEINTTASFVSYIEKHADNNNVFKYLKCLKNKGVDLNDIFK